jgi:aspartate aminotransferase
MSLTVSRRGQAMPASPIRRLMPFADDAKQRGIHVYHLNIGQPDIETPREMRERLPEIKDKVLAYSPSAGTPEFVSAFLDYYRRTGIGLERDQLLATTGGSEAILFAMFAVANDGDEVLVVEPFYANYCAFATMAGVRLVPITASGENGFHLPPREAFERAVTPRMKAVLLCNPGNPTGTVYTPEELKRVAEFCKDHDLFLISDEVYREFVYDGRVATSALSLPGCEEFVIGVDSLSKRYSACGIRLGCLVTRNKAVYQACLRMAQGRLSPPGLAQAIALGMGEIPPEYTRNVVVEYQKRRDILFEGLGTIPGVFLRKPEGAFYFIARLPVSDSDDFARFLLADFSLDGRTVMVAPAAGFYATPGLGRNEVRIAYVLNCDDLRASVRILGAALDAYGAPAQPRARSGQAASV